ncbi:hypothetical protein [Chryseobacterium sp.]|uniref:hypothetical protein n=1 Tax=Chryseobacterium sp. TaxID=1871047 RepID=UPI0023F53FCE|nr:hypothetical protein [Chryseobacterium sp.]
MKKLLISTILLVGLSTGVVAQKHPTPPPHPSKAQLVNSKANELDITVQSRKEINSEPSVGYKKNEARPAKSFEY